MKPNFPNIALPIFTLAITISFIRPTLAQDQVPVSITIDAAKTLGPLTPAWRFFGYDECNFTYMKDGKQLLAELGQLGPQQVFIRCHHLLTSGDGTPGMKWGSTGIYTEDAAGNPVYNFTIVDKIFDTYIQNGEKPYAQIGFMPKDLSTHPELYPKPEDISLDKRADAAAGQAYPPKDYNKWGELVYQWVHHCVDRYGPDEVAKWYWEVWNEPDISYWKGSQQDYWKLYDFAADGVRRALPTARIGGNEGASSVPALKGFLQHCLTGTNFVTGKTGSPLDFISFHAKGAPRFVDGHVQMGISNQLNRIDKNFAAIASFPELKDKPIVIGESDPDGCAACQGEQLAYRNTTLYPAYTAACLARALDLADQHGVNFTGALTWAFEFDDQPLFAGFRVLTTGGIDLPILNLFRMCHYLGGQRVAATSSATIPLATMLHSGVRGAPDVSALATSAPDRTCVLVWHYHDDDLPGPSANVSLTLTGLSLPDGPARLTHYRIDATHSNAFTVWQNLGSPATPTPAQYAQLRSAGQLQTLADAPATVTVSHGAAALSFDLPRDALSLLVIEPAVAP
jgi:xylan 1,4-beta-xylosidase